MTLQRDFQALSQSPSRFFYPTPNSQRLVRDFRKRELEKKMGSRIFGMEPSSIPAANSTRTDPYFHSFRCFHGIPGIWVGKDLQSHPIPPHPWALPGIQRRPRLLWEFRASPSQPRIFPEILFPAADPMTPFLRGGKKAGNSRCSLHWQLWIHKFLGIIQGNATSVDFIPDLNPLFPGISPMGTSTPGKDGKSDPRDQNSQNIP